MEREYDAVIFTENSLRNALAQAGLLARPKEGRLAKRVRRENGKRIQAWDFNLEEFKMKPAVEDDRRRRSAPPGVRALPPGSGPAEIPFSWNSLGDALAREGFSNGPKR